MFSLKGKRILVTGGSSGIGEATALALAKQGAIVVLAGRNPEKLKSVLSNLDGDGHISISEDLSNDMGIKALADRLEMIDGLVYSAGVIDYTLYKYFTREKYDNVFDVNFYAAIQLTNHLLKAKKISKGASLVYISSISSIFGVAATTYYAASKAALNAAVRVLASEVAPKKIRANCLLPGIVKTPMIDGASNMIDSDSFETAEKQYPLGLGKPEDIAAACVFLLSDESRWITGTSIVTDGGYGLI